MRQTQGRSRRNLFAPTPFQAVTAMSPAQYRTTGAQRGAALPCGAVIAQMAIAGSNAHKIGQIIRRIKTRLVEPIRVEDLASQANMSPSSFHQHFKAVTAMSPVQYQKQLRLTEARQILLAEKADAASAAYRVGYQSVSQFSREYARMFGAPPRRDVEGIRGAAVTGG